MSDEIWVEKYRPKTLDDVVISDKTLAKFREYVEKKDIPHLLFSGNAGIGKTTVAKILANSITDEVLYINSSDKTSVDVIRDQVSQFCSTMSFSDSSIKVIILDEFDGISVNAQKMLRGVMEQFANNCRFILTCNFENVILDAIHSRCQTFEFGSGSIQDVAKRCAKILKAENVDYGDRKQDIAKLVQRFFPDIRKIINDLQKCCTNGEFHYSEEVLTKDQKDELIKLLKGCDIKKIRKELLGTGADYPAFYTTLFDRAGELVDEQNKVPAMIMIGDYMNQHSTTINAEMNFVTCLLHICRLM